MQIYPLKFSRSFMREEEDDDDDEEEDNAESKAELGRAGPFR